LKYRFILFPVRMMLMLLAACEHDFTPLQVADPRGNYRSDCADCDVLFIGSSYLSYLDNNAPATFEKMAQAAGKSIHMEFTSNGGWKLSRHSESAQTIAKINERSWDYIILQGNAAYMSQEKWHYLVVPFIAELRRIIKANSSKTCVIYMMPWAYLDGLAWIEGETDDYAQMQQHLRAETIRVCRELDIATAPVGWAWYLARMDGYPADFYLNDLHHQSHSGAYFAACVYYSTIYLERAPYFEYDWDADNDPPYLHDLAHSVVLDSLDDWNIY
jgi:hypothetical protein